MAKKSDKTVVQEAFEKATRRAAMTIRPAPAMTRTRRGAARTAYTVSQLLEKHGDPRDTLLRIANMDVAKLMDLAQCTALEAIQEKRLSALGVLPYVGQKLPVQVDMRHTRAIHLNIVDDRQYAELVELASEPDDMAIEAQLVTPKGE
jgi:hypothetical protein